jgi:hypothetical protein
MMIEKELSNSVAKFKCVSVTSHSYITYITFVEKVHMVHVRSNTVDRTICRRFVSYLYIYNVAMFI